MTIPKTVNEALSHPRWRSAMIEEMKALDVNGTWDLVNLKMQLDVNGYLQSNSILMAQWLALKLIL